MVSSKIETTFGSNQKHKFYNELLELANPKDIFRFWWSWGLGVDCIKTIDTSSAFYKNLTKSDLSFT